jgi:DNA-binding phage protein
VTTSNVMSLSSVTSLKDCRIPAFEIGYLKAAAQDEAYESVLSAFLKESAAVSGITKAFIARRSGKSPEQITRYFSAPGNWTLDTYTVLCAAFGYKPVLAVEKICDMRRENACHDLVSECATIKVKEPAQVFNDLPKEPAPSPPSVMPRNDFQIKFPPADYITNPSKQVIRRENYEATGSRNIKPVPAMRNDIDVGCWVLLKRYNDLSPGFPT